MKKLLLLLGALLVLTTPASAFKAINQAVEEGLNDKSIPPSTKCSDEVFVRRAYLVLAGRLPSVEESLNFIDGTGGAKQRQQLISQLVESDDFVDMICLKWGDLLKVKSEFPSNIWPNGVQAYNRWIIEQVRANTPYDQFVRRLLLSTGSNFRSPEANFYRAFIKRTPEAIAENVELLFLGRRTPQSVTPQFFKQVRYKTTGEWKEEIVYIDTDDNPTTRSTEMEDGLVVGLNRNCDLRVAYVDWLTASGNKQFARVMANRVWYWIMGRGIVHEPDDFRADNLPSNSALLEVLTDKFIESGYDVRGLIKLIANSDAFQRSSLSNEDNAPMGGELFAYYPTIRLTAEQIIDGISRITGINDRYVSRVPEPYSYYPADLSSAQIGDATVSSPQLDLFGRPSRDYSLENQRSNEINNKQTLYLLNSNTIMEKIEKSNLLGEQIAPLEGRAEVVDYIYVMVLSRHASESEVEYLVGAIDRKADKREFANMVMWALLNSPEFIFNH